MKLKKWHTAEPLTPSSKKAERSEYAARFNSDTMTMSLDQQIFNKYKDRGIGIWKRVNIENGFELHLSLYASEDGKIEYFPVYRWTKVKGRKPYTLVEIDTRIIQEA